MIALDEHEVVEDVEDVESTPRWDGFSPTSRPLHGRKDAPLNGVMRGPRQTPAGGLGGLISGRWGDMEAWAWVKHSNLNTMSFTTFLHARRDNLHDFDRIMKCGMIDWEPL
jgi:hypothetical protein